LSVASGELLARLWGQQWSGLPEDSYSTASGTGAIIQLSARDGEKPDYFSAMECGVCFDEALPDGRTIVAQVSLKGGEAGRSAIDTAQKLTFAQSVEGWSRPSAGK
jgi:hypothetical protein